MRLIPKKTTKTRILFFLLADVFFIAFSVGVAFLIKFDGNVPQQYFYTIIKIVFLSVVFVIPLFYFQKLYFFSWSYVSTNELISLFKATTVSFLSLAIFIGALEYFSLFSDFPISIIFISYILVILLTGGLRLSKRVYFEVFRKTEEKEGVKLLIVGAGDAGEQILRSILSSKGNFYLPMGFIDDNPRKKGTIIHGLKILGDFNDIPKIIKEYAIESLIIALPSAGADAIKRAVELGRKAGLQKIKIVPSISEIMDGNVSVRDIHEIQVEDLLGRKQIILDTAKIENLILKKSVLITGAAGSIGSELSRQVAKFKPSSFLLLDQDETGLFNISEELKDKFPFLNIKSIIADTRDEEKINKIFNEFSPKIVFHAAAYKHVPLMEENPDEAIKNNVFGTKNVASAAVSNDTEKFIFISTDKAVNPSSVMGVTKRIGEMLCQSLNQKNRTKFISVRFGNVLNSRGSVIPIFREQIKKGGPVEVTHPEMKRYFMLISEACLLVMQAGAMGEGGEVFVLDMGEPIKIVDLAKEMIKLSGLQPDKDVPIIFTGKRPGEKMFEEILTAEEGTVATQNKKIFMAKLSNINPSSLEEKLEQLKKIIEAPEKEKITDFFINFVPHYKPSAE